MTALRLLLVGKRQGALAAAHRLEAEVLLLDDAAASPSLRRRVEGFARVDFGDVGACVAAARRLAGSRRPDAVIAVIERGVLGAAAIRRALDVRGAPPERAILWRDKFEMKRRVREYAIPCAEVRAIGPDTQADTLVRELGLPIVLKPLSSSGGRGTLIARERGEVRDALVDGWLAERFVHGVELSVESLVQNGSVVFENVTEYLHPGWANVLPAALPSRVDRAVRALNRRAIEALEVEDGLTHLEAFVDDSAPEADAPHVVFGELACRPPGGSLMELMQDAYGFDPWESQILVELGRPIAPPADAQRSTGVWFLHPGEGRVVSIAGLDDARAVAGIVRVECPLRVGQVVARREGVGQHTGRIVARTGSRDATALALERAHSLIHFALAA